MRTTRHVVAHVLAPAVAALAVGAVVLTPLLVAGPALAAGADRQPAGTHRPVASEPPARVDFTAGVRSTDHGAGIVTVTGTVPPGESVEVAGDVVEPVWTAGDVDGHWTARVHVHPGEHVVRATSQVSGQSIDLPVRMLVLLPPAMAATVDGIARTITLDGTGHPGAHLVVRDGGATRAETDVAADGTWHVVLRDLAFGHHHVAVGQYFDGALNGGVDDVYDLSGAPAVEHATASRQTEHIVLDGRAPARSALTFTDRRGPVTGADGEPVVVHVGDDTSWRAELPIPDDVRLDVITVTAHDGADEIGATDAHVAIPSALTGTVEQLDDGRVRLSGTGEAGGTVTLEDESGTTLTDADGEPLRTAIGRSWELVVPRDALPGAAVVAQQRVQDVEQGALRLVLPGTSGRPGPGTGSDTGPSAGSGTALPEGAHRPTAGRIHTGDARATAAGRLAYTGADVVRPAVASLVLLALGAAALPLAGVVRRRATTRR
ncbi:hypothetical protein [Curtobacterium sp. MCBD17_032]|uniref:hypothetical protein n=1 Tax=Curtobacterium sp. MCBD17_032 TaxID=2175659 RepID=UPI000DA920EE|nr:hypothetical protein [Curtobacterium sp. MCBD17_032]PZE86974.1 hypothetical protein DEI91_01350 [Curtobacterium sp. MCBD17_032]